MRHLLAFALLQTLLASEELELPQWKTYPTATCSELKTYLDQQCGGKRYSGIVIPFLIVGSNHTTSRPCGRCHLERKQTIQMCEQNPNKLWVVSLYDTRICRGQ